MKKFIFFLLVSIFIFNTKSFAQQKQPTYEDLLKQIKDLKSQVEELEDRISSAERHTVTDKVSIGIDFRTQEISAHSKMLEDCQNGQVV